ncbi:uncharacterized protein LACBIDRAFT_305268 [Laccaria bicolor S238N-H82]|uniref:Predicted protein n=1 Tax=Laccaria bicolor (strain S238N-H82 / ATCC MYA-4686) TaxID=486041 RepID=B0CTU4_LACBS|nr:uncharacterized protein LACBIDRAFT_305268 [Laccaria bicolor S238N-H82]EDR14558.1 predicted protein [Laccaria bicolor S238N-H82]|eukprot:XP_001875117.1 predicted protein [Laccaria bicolor S238N-H82]
MSGFVAGLHSQSIKLDDPFSTDIPGISSSEPQIQDFYEIHNTADVARRRIDQDIEKMEGAIRALKSRRNSLAAISRLPPEILSKIFLYCAATYRRPQLNMDWVRVTHVSRHWRTVAIGCPQFWTTLVFARPRWVEEMLKRSKMVPLVIDVWSAYMGAPKSIEGVQLAMNHTSRVRVLNITSSSASFGKLFSSVPRAAPILQTLVLTTSTNDYQYSELSLDNYSIPPELFSDDSSQLRHLELIHCNLDWTSHLLRGLTHLKIHDTAPGTRPSIPLFLDVLEQLPTLTVLDLKDALPHVADGSSTVSYKRNVKLHSLTILYLSSSDTDCSNALRHLSASSVATLQLYCRSTMVSDANFSSIMTFVSGLWDPTAIISSAEKLHKCPIRSLKIVGFDSVGFSLQAWPTVLSFQTLSDGGQNLQPSINLEFRWLSTVTSEYWDKVIGETCAALPLEQLASLDVLSACQITEQTFLRRFGKLTHLRSIRAPRLGVHTLLSAMIAEPSSPTRTDVSANSSTRKQSSNWREIPPAVYFPSLLHLTIETANFGNGQSAKLDDLKDCLVQRYERGAEVRELTLSQCYCLTAKHVDELREIVVDVIWDGSRRGTGFADSEDDYVAWDDIGDDMYDYYSDHDYYI